MGCLTKNSKIGIGYKGTMAEMVALPHVQRLRSMPRRCERGLRSKCNPDGVPKPSTILLFLPMILVLRVSILQV